MADNDKIRQFPRSGRDRRANRTIFWRTAFLMAFFGVVVFIPLLGQLWKIQITNHEKYEQMAKAARKEGLSMLAVSTYRTESYQRGLYNNKVATAGKVYADNYSARPGHSEHQTGMAIDIGSTEGVFEYTPEFKWLQKHAHEYGFILRYMKGKEWITGYSYEPWHYRYVGVDVAKIIHDEGITYEEYYAKYISVNEFR